MSREIKTTEPIIQSSKSFDGKHSLIFNDRSHRYKLDGEACPGVTSVLKASYPTSMGLISWMQGESVKYALNQVEILLEEGIFGELEYPRIIKDSKLAWKEKAQEAADIGTITHGYAELYSKGKEIEAGQLLGKITGTTQWPLINSCVEKYLDWHAHNKGEFISAEGLIASIDYKYCGKYDLLSKRNGYLVLSDYKTSKGIYTEQLIQLAAYRLALKEWCDINIDAIEILRFGKEDGEFETRYIYNKNELKKLEEQAIRCVQTYYFIKEFDKE